MREVDVKLARYLMDKHGPYHLRVQTRPEGFTCDLCGTHVHKALLGVAVEDMRKELYVCLVNRCAEVMFGNKVASQLRLAAMSDDREKQVFDPRTAEFEVAKTDAETLVEALTKEIVSVDDVVLHAQRYLAAGYGRRWRIVKSIVKQAEDGKALSAAQLKTLKKFNRACHHESEALK